MIQAGFVRHTVNKSSFSEQCYYTFGDIASALQSCNIKVSVEAALMVMIKPLT